MIIAGGVAIRPEKRDEAIQPAVKVAALTQSEEGDVAYRFYPLLTIPLPSLSLSNGRPTKIHKPTSKRYIRKFFYSNCLNLLRKHPTFDATKSPLKAACCSAARDRVPSLGYREL